MPALNSGGRPRVDVVAGPPTVPDVRGLAAREAVRRLAKLGLVARVTGTGTVIDQDPAGRLADRAGPRLPPLAGPHHHLAAASHLAAMTLGELLTVLARERPDRSGGAGDGVPAGRARSRRQRHRVRLAGGRARVACSSRCAARRRTAPSFAGQAVAKGAIAVVAAGAPPASCAAPWIRVADDRLALAALSAAFYRHPSRDLRVIGITGTNGKTTCAYLVREMFEAAGVPCGLMGTVHYRIGDTVREAVAHHARGHRPAADVPRDGRRRLRGVRDGSVVARALAEARRRTRGSRPASSPTSRATTSTSTRTWTSTSPRSAGCSSCCPRARRRWSTSTTRAGAQLALAVHSRA